ncbi:uncharacterized protein LOC100906630 [Galendromus occidentalis]|uniref:Uncharacterized protein LOC100906630 n=1 Tax=Galendromus occidentalis TaxID=34638 RepID=A0AAJ6QPZ0_9ACAR|nr:uncharacterized protein LOC100906630 [Galendromus occidentalis]
MSWLATFVVLTTVNQFSLISCQERRNAPWGFLSYPGESNATIFVVKIRKHTECVFLYKWSIDESVGVAVDGSTFAANLKFKRICNQSETKIEYSGVEGKLASIFYRILDVGEFSRAVLDDVCVRQRTCRYERSAKTEASKFVLLTSPIARQEMTDDLTFTHRLDLRNDTMALVDLDPIRIDMQDKDVLEIHRCDDSEILFSVNTTSLTRRTIFKHFGSDLCITYISRRAPGISTFAMPCQLVQLFLQEANSRVLFFNVMRRSEPTVDLLILEGNSQIQEDTSKYYCDLHQVDISEGRNDHLLISRSSDLRSDVSLQISRTGGEAYFLAEIHAVDIYVAVFQNIVWEGKLSDEKSLSTLVASIGCQQEGDAKVSPDDRYNYGAVFCVYVKTRVIANSGGKAERSEWSEIKKTLRGYIFTIANNESFVNETGVEIRSENQIDIPENNPIVYAARDYALVRLVFVITKEESYAPEYNESTHYRILEELRHHIGIDDDFRLAPHCHVEISLERNLIFFGLLVLICTITFGAIWRFQLNSDVQRKVIAQINEQKRRKSNADWWGSGESELPGENSSTNTRSEYVNKAFVPEAGPHTEQQSMPNKLDGTSLAMKSRRKKDSGSKIPLIVNGELPLSVPGGLGGQMRMRMQEENEITSPL